jgi:hypothetical protein
MTLRATQAQLGVEKRYNPTNTAGCGDRQEVDKMIAGQSPSIEWRPNLRGEIRTLEEAVGIAERHGVIIPSDVAFFVDELNELDENRTACGPRVDKAAGSTVYWTDLIHKKTGKVPFRLWAGILGSDEAIVAVFAHELFELEQLRPLLEEGKTTIEDFIAHTRPGNPKNLHDQAWAHADRLIERIRKENEP